MPVLSPSIAEAVFSACTAGAPEAAGALERALDGPLTLHVEAPDRIAFDRLPSELTGPGLVVVLCVGKQAAVVVLPETSRLLPSWCAAPDATGRSKLSTLAQELGMLLLPDDCAVERFEWTWAASLAGALGAGGVAEGAAMIPMPATTEDGRRGVLRLIWPAANPEGITRPTETAPAGKPADAGGGKPVGKPDAASSGRASRGPAGLRGLPVYSRSLLRVKVPLVVTLAQKRQPIGWIVELGPGSIIQFDKSCEEMLDLHLGNRMIANGEAVKVGDKFGLRITNIVLPEERFHPVKKA